MAAAAKVYAKQLIAKGLGYPLWVPEPTCKVGEVQFEVQIGDVGVITKAGSFFRLFNATHPANHPINGGRVPANFEPLVLPDYVIEKIPNFLEPGPVCSESVRKVDVSVDASANTSGGHVGASYRFTCDQNQGALLVLKDYANREQAMAEDILNKYVGKHCQSWLAFATGTFGLVAKLNDIVLVGGWVKTSAWAIAAFLDKGTAHEVSIGTGDGPYPKFNISVSVAKNVSMSVNHRSGPVRSAAPEQTSATAERAFVASEQVPTVARDQCVFTEIYKAKRRLRDAIPSKMKAAAEPTDDHRPPTPDHDIVSRSPSMDSDEDVMQAEPVIMSFRDPLEDILDYILEHSDADIVVASQSCLNKLCLLAGHEAHTHDAEGLRQCLPEIHIDEQKVGTLRLPALQIAWQEVDHTGVLSRIESSAHAQAPIPPQTHHTRPKPSRTGHYTRRNSSEPARRHRNPQDDSTSSSDYSSMPPPQTSASGSPSLPPARRHRNPQNDSTSNSDYSPLPLPQASTSDSPSLPPPQAYYPRATSNSAQGTNNSGYEQSSSSFRAENSATMSSSSRRRSHLPHPYYDQLSAPSRGSRQEQPYRRNDQSDSTSQSDLDLADGQPTARAQMSHTQHQGHNRGNLPLDHLQAFMNLRLERRGHPSRRQAAHSQRDSHDSPRYGSDTSTARARSADRPLQLLNVESDETALRELEPPQTPGAHQRHQRRDVPE